VVRVVSNGRPISPTSPRSPAPPFRAGGPFILAGGRLSSPSPSSIAWKLLSASPVGYLVSANPGRSQPSCGPDRILQFRRRPELAAKYLKYLVNPVAPGRTRREAAGRKAVSPVHSLWHFRCLSARSSPESPMALCFSRFLSSCHAGRLGLVRWREIP